MKCSIQGCPGEYEEKYIFHTVRHKGQITVIDHVPADVCLICGDVLFKPEIVRHIETVLKESTQPVSSVPLCEYA
jgi:YgiT-type zinc finger domain-containing protein